VQPVLRLVSYALQGAIAPFLVLAALYYARVALLGNIPQVQACPLQLPALSAIQEHTQLALDRPPLRLAPTVSLVSIPLGLACRVLWRVPVVTQENIRRLLA